MGILHLRLEQEHVLHGIHTERGEVNALLLDLRHRRKLEEDDTRTVANLIDDLFERVWELEDENKGLKANSAERLKELFEKQVEQLKVDIEKIEEDEYAN